MEEYSSGCFTEEERTFVRMIENGGILVEDRWFPAESTELERARYRVSYLRRQERNRRRREKRQAENHEPRARNVRVYIPINTESQRENRLILERRKCLRRATVARCPTPAEIRAAWEYRHASPQASLRLGGLLLDLECYVDNALVTIWRNGRPQIVARAKGIRGWIRENCPELEPKYKTLMRFRAVAKALRQKLDIHDPIPTSVLLDPSADPTALADQPLHIQPRGSEQESECELVRNRFVWELSEIKIDAKLRFYRDNENYWYVSHDASYCRTSTRHTEGARQKLADIILDGTGKCAIENYVLSSSKGVPRSSAAVERRLERAALRGLVGRRKGIMAQSLSILEAYLDLARDPYRFVYGSGHPWGNSFEGSTFE